VVPAGEGGPSVVALLRDHGLRSSTARAVAQVGEDLRVRTERQGSEFAALLAVGTGALVGPVLGGQPAEVPVGGQLQAMQAGRRYIHLHTHPPPSAAFSDADVGMLVTYAGLRTMAVIGVDRTWYVLSKVPGQTLRAEVEQGFTVQVAALAPKYARLIRSGALSVAEAWRLHTHEVWEQLAPRLGLRYDRVEP
jgi:hypothetical protein